MGVKFPTDGPSGGGSLKEEFRPKPDFASKGFPAARITGQAEAYLDRQ